MQTIAAQFRTEDPITATATHLRGYIASRFPQRLLLHQHDTNGTGLRYSYPRVQYKILDGVSVVIGLNEGVEVIKALYPEIDYLNLAGKNYPIVETSITEKVMNFSRTEISMAYRFFTPWLALNEQNYDRYQRAGSGERRDMLRRILIGNILSMSKGLGYVVTEEIKVSKLDVYPVKEPVWLKGVRMVGFKGTFAVNFELPDYIGLGKSVSRGFGTIKRVQELES